MQKILVNTQQVKLKALGGGSKSDLCVFFGISRIDKNRKLKYVEGDFFNFIYKTLKIEGEQKLRIKHPHKGTKNYKNATPCVKIAPKGY